jgi:hypothetical protein
MHRLSQSLLMAGIGIAGAAMLLDMAVRGLGRPTELQPAPTNDAPLIACPTCPADGTRLAEAAAGPHDVHDLATLTPDQAAALNGKTAFFRVVIDSTSSGVQYDILPSGDPQGTLFLAKRRTGAQDLTGELIVRATLQVVRRKGFTSGMVKVASHTEYRLSNGELVCP